jgi:hypothetical protein
MAGIFHEISFDAIIRNNIVENDGYDPGGSLWYGAGILVGSSTNVEVYGNTVTNCMNGIGASQANRGYSRNGQQYLVRNLNVHHNTITQSTGTAAGIIKDSTFDNTVYYLNGNNRFESNTYKLTDPSGKYFEWMNAARTRMEWTEYGQDVGGSFQ